MVILTLNCGSSSVKYQVYDWATQEVLAKGAVERVGTDEAFIGHKAQGKEEVEIQKACKDHKDAIDLVLSCILDKDMGVLSDISEIKAVGHRVLHGGEKIKQSVLIDDEVLKTFKEIEGLGPLHIPANVMGIEAAQKVLPDVPHAAIMDTAWHQTMPETSFLYAVPYEWYQKYSVRRYGFHGTSFLYTAKRAAVLLGKKPEDTNLIIAHIGNGASINAVKNGKSFDTSMGLTPLEGLIMGTRSGDLDPAIINYIKDNAGYSSEEIETILNKKSGVLGISTKYTDRRDIRDGAAAGDKQCQLAVSMECYRIRKYIGSYLAALDGNVDAIVFTAGVGEMAPHIRGPVLEGLEALGIEVDLEKNKTCTSRNAEFCISKDSSRIKIFVIPTDEELVMTEDAYALMNGTYDVHTNFTYSFQSKDYDNKERSHSLPKDIEKNPKLKDIIVSPK
ncbi:acetate kinase [Spirochaeta cellobiosiphila]|uniref:acetate kinase n=1 Tax=Spirochaeta cellobiosiphila TaxID=504483 RepID=UPI00041DACC6|nr:acetate kinase [Spirochaeta cellobiosiphila]